MKSAEDTEAKDMQIVDANPKRGPEKHIRSTNTPRSTPNNSRMRSFYRSVSDVCHSRVKLHATPGNRKPLGNPRVRRPCLKAVARPGGDDAVEAASATRT